MMFSRKSAWSVRSMLCAEWQSLHTGSGLDEGCEAGRVDAVDEHFVDAAVALGAGLRDVGAVHAGARVAGGQFQVRAVAIGAVGRHGESGFEQAPPVDAFLVVLHNVVLLAVVAQGRLLAGAVALGAQVRHVAREGRRIRIDLCPARRGCHGNRCSRAHRGCPWRPTARACFACNRPPAGVADGAIHFGRDGLAGPLLGWRAARVALHAGYLGVARVLQAHPVSRTARRSCPRATVFSSGLAWHRWQSRSAMPCG